MLTFVIIFYIANVVFSRVLPEESSIFSSIILPTDDRLWATVSNGYIGTKVLSDTVYIGGVYNGYDQYDNNSYTTHRARIEAYNSIYTTFPNINIIDILTNYSLDVNNAIFTITKSHKTFTMQQHIYAHRSMKNLLITQVTINNSINNQDLNINLFNNKGKRSSDFNFKKVNCNNPTINTVCSIGSTLYSETNSSLITIAIVYLHAIDDIKGYNITVPKHTQQTYYFPVVMTTSLEYNINSILSDSVNLFNSYYNIKEEWIETHISEWNNIWNKGRIDIIGNIKDAQNVYSSLHYIISSVRNNWSFGLSPGSLSSNGYNGHVFWDQETWMFPMLAVLHSNLSKSCLQYRFDKLNGSKFNANYQSAIIGKNFNGSIKFAWESAYSGIEALPLWAKTGIYEVHINADIGLAIKQYYYLTKNKTWLQYIGYPMINGICEFWQKWSVFKDNKYQWLNVMPPDEYHYPVNNSVYTNNAIRTIFIFGVEISNILNIKYPKEWDNIINNTYIPFDNKLNYHPEYDGYNTSIIVKQADTILLSFPWEMEMKTNVLENDLNIYQNVTDPSGPAMTWSMFLINWLTVKQYDKADSFYDASCANIQHPFKIWTETPHGGTTNFITGAGGFLQVFLFGYGAIRIQQNGLFINFNHLPVRNRGWTQLNLIGVNFVGNEIDLRYYKDLSMTIYLASVQPAATSIQVLFGDNSIQKIQLNKTITVLSSQQPLIIQTT